MDKTAFEPIVYAARIKDRKRLYISSSGGIFTALSDYMLERKYAVVCSVYNYDDSEMRFCLITNKTQRDDALGSKYIQSNMQGIYKQAIHWLKNNPDKKLAFCGMGCQAAAFKSVMNSYNLGGRVIIIDIICQGVTSPNFWKHYVEFVGEKYNGEVTHLTFKDKRWNWKSPLAFAYVKGKEAPLFDFVKIMNDKLIFRPSCYVCPYATVKRDTDITVGDYWRIEKVMPSFYDSKGTSLVIVQSATGKQLFDNIINLLDYRVSTIDDAMQPSLKEPVAKPDLRSAFWCDYRNNNIKFVIDKYGKLSKKEEFKLLVKCLIGKVKSTNV